MLTFHGEAPRWQALVLRGPVREPPPPSPLGVTDQPRGLSSSARSALRGLNGPGNGHRQLGPSTRRPMAAPHPNPRGANVGKTRGLATNSPVFTEFFYSDLYF